jgi:hypothetical protein
MFDKAYFEKEFPKQLERFKKESKSNDAKVAFVCGENHILVTEIEEIKEAWISVRVHDGEYKSEGKSPVLMFTLYEKIHQVFFYPLKGEHALGFRTQ